MGYACEIIADSVSQAGKRITTVKATYPRFVHSELLTHRMLSRNSSSSRAIPVEKMMKQVREDPAMPVYWGANRRGMQAGAELTDQAGHRLCWAMIHKFNEVSVRVGSPVRLGLDANGEVA